MLGLDVEPWLRCLCATCPGKAMESLRSRSDRVRGAVVKSGRHGVGLPARGGPMSQAWRHAKVASAPHALTAVALVGVEEGESEARRGRAMATAGGCG
jgi:hypothetical protein